MFSVLLFTAPRQEDRPPRHAQVSCGSLDWFRALFSFCSAMNEPPDCTIQCLHDSLKHQFHEGIRLFNSAHFFEAHEALEDVWRGAPERQRKFLQGLIQIAVALHHHSKGNLIGCRSLLQRGVRNLAPYPDFHFGLELAVFRDDVGVWREALESERPLPGLPSIRLSHQQLS